MISERRLTILVFVFCILCFLFLLSLFAFAQESEIPVTLSWQHPTTRVDSSPLDTSLIMETRIWCDMQGGWPPTAFAPPSATSVELSFSPGVHSCYLKTALTEKGADDKPLVSDASSVLEFTVEPPRASDPAKPEAPREIKATQIYSE